MSDSTLAFIFSQVFRTPLLIVYLVALVLAVRRRQALGEVALFAGLGFGALAFSSLVSAGFMYWQITSFARGASADEIAGATGYLGFAHLAELVGAVLVIIAVFWRRPNPIPPAGGA